MRRGGLTLLVLLTMSPQVFSGDDLEMMAAEAGRPFDLSLSGKKASEPEPEFPWWHIGPAVDEEPSYAEGLLGSSLGTFLAPIALGLEMTQAAILTPVRFARSILQGDMWAWLEPIRTAKNLLQDVLVTFLGMLSSATGPVWNAFFPEYTTDFMYVNNRLVFDGGPANWIFDKVARSAFGMAPSWHTVLADKGITRWVLRHEFMHNMEWGLSLGWENVDFYHRLDDKNREGYINLPFIPKPPQ